MTAFVFAAGEVWTNPIIVGLVVGLPATIFGFIGFRRAEELDQAAVRAAAVAVQGDQVQRVIDGLDKMVDNLQIDNREVREKVADLRRRLAECNAAYVELKRMTGRD